MKCRFCGKNMRKSAAYCPKCGKSQSYDALPEGDEYEEYYEDDIETEYTYYDESDSGMMEEGMEEDYVPPVTRKKKSKLPVLLIGAVAVVAAVVLFLFGGGSDDDETGGDATKPGQSVEQSGQAYDLVWPDLMAYLGEGNYEKVMEVSSITFGADGKEGKIYEILIHKDQLDQIENYMELLEEYHFELDEERDGYYFYRFTGSNAPDTVTSKDAKYHVMVALAEERGDYQVVRCTWVDGFERDMSVSAPGNTNRPVQTQPVETKPVETKPVETEPVETEPVATTRPAETKPVSNDSLVLQDPCKFLGCRTGENFMTTSSTVDGKAWLVSCKFDIDTGRRVATELITLFCEEYPFELIRTSKADFISTSASIFYGYVFEYTGSNPLVDGFLHKEDDEMVHCALRMSLYHNYRAGWMMMSLYFDPDLVLEDEGHRASELPVDYTGSSEQELESVSNPDWNKNVLQCTACDGDGDCSECNDFGYLWSSASDSYDRNCWRCNNSGVCQTCYGTGKR